MGDHAQGLTFRLEHDSLGQEYPQVVIDTQCPFCDYEQAVFIEALREFIHANV